jgi:hypothetical protein
VIPSAKTAMQERMETRKAFFASLGECITAWATVERTLFDLFHRALGGDNRDKSALVFWAIPSFSMRLSYTSMLVEHCLKTRDGKKSRTQNKKSSAQKEWAKLEKKVTRHSEFRNYLAHQPVTQDKIEDDESGITITRVKDAVIPNALDKKKEFAPITQPDLEAHLKDVSLINLRLWHFMLNLGAMEEIALKTFRDQDQE